MPAAHLAIDLGASSGRAMLGFMAGEPSKLELVEVHRFEHHSCATPTGPVWDLTGLWREILQGLSAGVRHCRQRNCEMTSIGVDAWGVDWVVMGEGGEVLGLPHCYRDPRNQAACKQTLEMVGGYEKLYARTGIQLMPFNTLFQLHAAHSAEPRLFDAAHRLLFLPDLFHYWLSGEMAVERTIASTSSMLDVSAGDWDRDLVERIGLRSDLLGPIIEPGTQIGVLRGELAELTGAPPTLRVIVPASHDTASAVAAVPAMRPSGWAYLSSGTWSLLGAELALPLATPDAARASFTNERGVGGSVRLLKNIAGLWLVQELRREFIAAGRSYSFPELDELATKSEPFRTLINPNDPRFGALGAISTRIAAFADETGQPAPVTPGQLVRCCLESLALCYRTTADELARLLGQPLATLHVVGGGSKNRLLNQFTADASACGVLCGPTEATAIGNVLVQALGCGVLADAAEIRQIVARSFPVEKIDRVGDGSAWEAALVRYLHLI